MKREFLMLAHTYVPENVKKFNVQGWYISEKLDGIRCFWDGGVSRGLPCSEIPYANCAKDSRFLSPPIATGLWSRYGKAINAPASFLDFLPTGICLDGELWAGRGNFQQTVSITRSSVNSKDWEPIKYMVFDQVTPQNIFDDFEINNTNFKASKGSIPFKWFNEKLLNTTFYGSYRCFEDRYDHLQGLPKSKNWEVLPQVKLPWHHGQCVEQIKITLDNVIKNLGEGVMFRKPESNWEPKRSYNLLKYKPFNDMEGVIVGYTWGKETDVDRSVSGESTNRLLGLMGSLKVQLANGKQFDLASGFKLHERILKTKFGTIEHDAKEEGIKFPGSEAAKDVYNPLLPVGLTITFRYRELTLDGLPKEARYLRPSENNE